VGAATKSVKRSWTSATMMFVVETVELVARVPTASALVAPRRSAESGGVTASAARVSRRPRAADAFSARVGSVGP